MTKLENIYFTDGQLKEEIAKCEYCEEKPCQTACPANCSPADFIMAASEGRSFDYVKAAKEIFSANPLGEICAVVCPDSHCVAACSKKKFGNPLDIPKIQATIVKKARGIGFEDRPAVKPPTGKKVAIIGGGPAGLGAAALLASEGHSVSLYEKDRKTGGAARLIAQQRLPHRVIDDDRMSVLSYENIEVFYSENIEDPSSLLKTHEAVIVATGLAHPIRLDIPGADDAVDFAEYLSRPHKHPTDGSVAIIGGGAVAVDSAIDARESGAKRVEMFVLERLEEMPLTGHELQLLLKYKVDVSNRERLISMKKAGDTFDLKTVKVRLNGETFALDQLKDETGTEQ